MVPARPRDRPAALGRARHRGGAAARGEPVVTDVGDGFDRRARPAAVELRRAGEVHPADLGDLVTVSRVTRVGRVALTIAVVAAIGGVVFAVAAVAAPAGLRGGPAPSCWCCWPRRGCCAPTPAATPGSCRCRPWPWRRCGR